MFSAIIFFILSKYTSVLPEPVVPWSTETSNLLFFEFKNFKALFCSWFKKIFFALEKKELFSKEDFEDLEITFKIIKTLKKKDNISEVLKKYAQKT